MTRYCQRSGICSAQLSAELIQCPTPAPIFPNDQPHHCLSPREKKSTSEFNVTMPTCICYLLRVPLRTLIHRFGFCLSGLSHSAITQLTDYPSEINLTSIVPTWPPQDSLELPLKYGVSGLRILSLRWPLILHSLVVF